VSFSHIIVTVIVAQTLFTPGILEVINCTFVNNSQPLLLQAILSGFLIGSSFNATGIWGYGDPKLGTTVVIEESDFTGNSPLLISDCNLF